jgi:transposase
MFVRRKINKSGVVSIQVIDKSSGSYRVSKTMGSSSDKDEIENLYTQGLHWVSVYGGQKELDFTDERQLFERFLSGIRQISVSGTELLLGKLFDQIGFGHIPDVLFRQLVLARICYPVSKLRTVDYLKKYHYQEVDEDTIYRYLDKLYNTQKQAIQQISYEHTLGILGGKISIVFYDVTTLYFEIDHEDELRKTGFSKEGKHQNPQIILGLLISIDGYPLAYEIHEGNKFEGYTMLPVIDAFMAKYGLDNLVVVADSGLLSNENIDRLNSKGYEFILGARIRNETKQVKDKILSLGLQNGQSTMIKKGDTLRLVVSYSDKRAKKDSVNREKGLFRLQKRVKSGKLTKASINNRGYNKYLIMKGDVEIKIDMGKYEQDGKWDGIKGYLTNTKLSKDEVIENYSHLWKIEKAFRISKNDLKIRPIYHRLQPRIEAHICIAFVAYKIYKELERQLKEKRSTLSPEKAINIAKTIYTIKLETSATKELIEKTIILNDEQRNLAQLFDF